MSSSMSTWNNPDEVLKRELKSSKVGKNMCGAHLGNRRMRGYLKTFPKNMQCPLSFALMLDPVIAQDDIIYDRNNIQRWFDDGFNVSPTTNEPISGMILVPAHDLKSEIEQWKIGNISELHRASCVGDIETVKLMATKDMNSKLLNCLDLDRKTPLEYATFFKHTEIVTHLLSCVNIIPLYSIKSQSSGDNYLLAMGSHMKGFALSDFNAKFKLFKKQLRMEQETDKYYGQRKEISSCINGSDEGERYQQDWRIGGFLKAYPGYGEPNYHCPLSYDLLDDPVIAEDGVSYERYKIKAWFEAGFTISPITNESIGMKLVPNNALKSEIDQWIAANISQLHMACHIGDIEEVQRLIHPDTSADLINILDVQRMTPLECAAAQGNTDVAKVLLNCVNILIQHDKQHQIGALHVAAKAGHAKIVSILLEDDRVDVNILSTHNHQPVRSPLKVAALFGHESVVSIMLSNSRVDVNQQEGDTKTAFHSAACNGQTAIVQIFLACERVDVNKPCLLNVISPLNDAVDYGHLDVVRLLVNDIRVDINRVDQSKWSPLHTAARHGSETTNMMGITVSAYRESKEEERYAIVCLLLADKRIIVDSLTAAGYTPLMCSMSFDYVPVSVIMRFLHYGIGLDRCSDWYNGSVEIRFAQKLKLYRYAVSLPELLHPPLLNFHMCRLNAANNINSLSALRVFVNCWPDTINECIANFMLPTMVARRILGQVIENFIANVNGGEDGISTLYKMCGNWRQFKNADILSVVSISNIELNKLGPSNAAGLKRSPMKLAKDDGADDDFLKILRNAGGQSISQHGDSSPEIDGLTLIVRDETSQLDQSQRGCNTVYISKESVSLQDILNLYASKVNVNRDYLNFCFNHIEIGKNETCESLMLEEKSIIDVMKVMTTVVIFKLDNILEALQDDNTNVIRSTEVVGDHLSVEDGVKWDIKWCAANQQEKKKEEKKRRKKIWTRETKQNKPKKKKSVVTVIVKDQFDNETFFKIKKTTKLSRVFAAYAAREGFGIESFHFSIDGEVVDPAETSESLGLENKDQIRCIKPPISPAIVSLEKELALERRKTKLLLSEVQNLKKSQLSASVQNVLKEQENKYTQTGGDININIFSFGEGNEDDEGKKKTTEMFSFGEGGTNQNGDMGIFSFNKGNKDQEGKNKSSRMFSFGEADENQNDGQKNTTFKSTKKTHEKKDVKSNTGGGRTAPTTSETEAPDTDITPDTGFHLDGSIIKVAPSVDTANYMGGEKERRATKTDKTLSIYFGVANESILTFKPGWKVAINTIGFSVVNPYSEIMNHLPYKKQQRIRNALMNSYKVLVRVFLIFLTHTT